MPQTRSKPIQRERVISLIIIQHEVRILLAPSPHPPPSSPLRRPSGPLDEVAEALGNVLLGYIKQKGGGRRILAAVGVLVVVDGEAKAGKGVG